MPAILRDLPFFDHPTTAEVGGQRYLILAHQPLVWVSLSHIALDKPSPEMLRFPAVYDSGFTGAFLMHRQHLQRFAGLHPSYLIHEPAEAVRLESRL